MNGIEVFALEIASSVGVSTLVLLRLQGRLQRVGTELCGRPGAAEFWVAYMQLMLYIAPLALLAFFSRAGSVAPALNAAEQLKSSMLLIMIGQFAGLVLMGRAVWKSIPRESAGLPAPAAAAGGAS